MSITLNPPIVITANRREGEGSSPLLDFLPARAENILYGEMTVKEALDALFSSFGAATPAERGWQKFTETGEFIVPDGVTRVLVLCIGAGSSTANTRGGGVLVSRYLPVTPGETIPVQVGVPQTPGGTVYGNPAAVEKLCSSFNGTTLKASWRGIYHVDGTQYTFANSSPTFPAALSDAEMCTAGCVTPTASAGSTAGSGSGGYAVALDVPDERAAWLELARDMRPGTTNNNMLCYPDTSQKGTSASGNRYYKAGNGANYGGVAGSYAGGQGYASYAGKGGQGLVCVFWGDDIEKDQQETPSPAPFAHRKEDATTLTPLNMAADAGLFPYTNTEAGLAEGSTVKDALDALYARLAEKGESA